MEFGIFDFYKVFSKAFGEGEDSAGGLEWKRGDVIKLLTAELRSITIKVKKEDRGI